VVYKRLQWQLDTISCARKDPSIQGLGPGCDRRERDRAEVTHLFHGKAPRLGRFVPAQEYSLLRCWTTASRPGRAPGVAVA
jgi:hypothetical protein